MLEKRNLGKIHVGKFGKLKPRFGANGEWGYSTRCHMLGPERPEAVLPERPEAVLPDRALCLSAFSHVLSDELLALLRDDIGPIVCVRACVRACLSPGQLGTW